MTYLRVIDQAGNNQDFEVAFVPRIGERILLEYARERGAPIETHYLRVKDVMYRPDNKPEHQVAILVEEESNQYPWLYQPIDCNTVA